MPCATDFSTPTCIPATCSSTCARDYHRTAQVHFEASHVPPHRSVRLRAGDPCNRRADPQPHGGGNLDGELLTLLFEITGLFDMKTRRNCYCCRRPWGGRGRGTSFDPNLDMWATAEPVVREWIERHLGPAGRLEDVARGAGEVSLPRRRTRPARPRRDARRPARCRNARRPGAGARSRCGDRPCGSAAQPLDRAGAVGDRRVAGGRDLEAGVIALIAMQSYGYSHGKSDGPQHRRGREAAAAHARRRQRPLDGRGGPPAAGQRRRRGGDPAEPSTGKRNTGPPRDGGAPRAARHLGRDRGLQVST